MSGIDCLYTIGIKADFSTNSTKMREILESSYICNQSAGFNRCLNKEQENMQMQLRVINTEHCKGKSARKFLAATDELQYLMDFNSSISQAMARTIEHLSDSVFISMANLTLTRRDSYLAHIRSGIKPNTVAAFRAVSHGQLGDYWILWLWEDTRVQSRYLLFTTSQGSVV